MFPKALNARNWAGCVFPWPLRHMATGTEEQTSHSPVWSCSLCIMLGTVDSLKSSDVIFFHVIVLYCFH